VSRKTADKLGTDWQKACQPLLKRMARKKKREGAGARPAPSRASIGECYLIAEYRNEAVYSSLNCLEPCRYAP
jgi:hypothetical protein